MGAIVVDDAGFVRAPASLVYRRLTDVAAWPDWWPGARVERWRHGAVSDRRLEGFSDLRLQGDDPRLEGDLAVLELRAGVGRRLRLGLRVHGWRHEQGFLMDVDGAVVGRAEWWLEAVPTGTVVHHLLDASPRDPRHAAVWRRGYRRAVRRGLWGLKDVMEAEMRRAAGVAP